jgi:hypothetical protein
LALKRLISFGIISGRKGGSLFFWGGIHRERVLEIRCMYALLARESVVISNLKSQFNTVHHKHPVLSRTLIPVTLNEYHPTKPDI